MKSPYKMLGLEMGLDFLIMYAVMYVMVNTASNIYLNVNNFYMTGMMVTPMLAIMIIMMRSMLPDKRLNPILITGSAVLFFTLFAFVRAQTFVGDKSFITSMIPHHSGAILMCENAKISDVELKNLCSEIVSGQRKEIDQMKAILARLKR